MKMLYMALPYDDSGNLSNIVPKKSSGRAIDNSFLYNKKLPGPEISFSYEGKNYTEQWPQGLAALFYAKDIILEPVVPTCSGIRVIYASAADKALDTAKSAGQNAPASPASIDYSACILQPFKNALFYPELLRFKKVIFPDGDYVINLTPPGFTVVNLYEKAVFLSKNSGRTGIFTSAVFNGERDNEHEQRFFKNTKTLEDDVQKISYALQNDDYSYFLTLKDLGYDIDA